MPKLGLGTGLDFASTFDQQLLGEAAAEFPFPIVDAFEALKNMTIKECVRIHTAFKATLEGNLVFGTGNEFIGIGPDSTLEGDVVCVIAGCRVPVLLRRERDHYRLVGTCAVQDLMNEELMTEIGEELRKLVEGVPFCLETFHIH